MAYVSYMPARADPDLSVPDRALPGPATSAPLPDATSRLGFYLFDAATVTPTAVPRSMVILPCDLAWGATRYVLAAAMCDDTEHAALLAQFPKPSGWTGSVGDARRALRDSQLIGWWWVFASYIERQGVETSGHYRHF